MTEPSRGNARRTTPDFPLSFPDITLTLSPFLIFIKILYHFRRERYDGVPTAFRELARHGAEDAVALWRHLLALLLYKHNCILVKADIGAVLARERVDLPYDDGAVDVLLLHGLPWSGGLDGDDDRVADAGVAAMAPAEHLEDARDLTAGIICNRNDGLWL